MFGTTAPKSSCRSFTQNKESTTEWAGFVKQLMERIDTDTLHFSVSKNYGHREPARRLVHPRVVSLALRAIHLLAIPQNLRETYVF